MPLSRPRPLRKADRPRLRKTIRPGRSLPRALTRPGPPRRKVSTPARRGSISPALAAHSARPSNRRSIKRARIMPGSKDRIRLPRAGSTIFRARPSHPRSNSPTWEGSPRRIRRSRTLPARAWRTSSGSSAATRLWTGTRRPRSAMQWTRTVICRRSRRK